MHTSISMIAATTTFAFTRTFIVIKDYTTYVIFVATSGVRPTLTAAIATLKAANATDTSAVGNIINAMLVRGRLLKCLAAIAVD